MSHILLKKVQDNLISTPASNYVKFFSNDSDNGLLYYKDSSGVATPVSSGSGTTYDPVINTTYSSLYSLYQSNGFATGSYYYISDFESIYDQPDFYFDGVPKTTLDYKVKPAIPYQPIIVMATSKNTLCPDAYQPYYPNDKIKYDLTWRYTETHKNAKGRITERIDSNGNRTDYDHRTIRFKRYQTYDRDGVALSGTITDWNCVTGEITGDGSALFSSELTVGDVIILDTDIAHGGDRYYSVGLKIKHISSNSAIIAVTASLYAAGAPSTVTLDSGSQIVPTTTSNYSFSGKNYTFYKASASGVYSSYKEVYFGQGSTSSVFPSVDYDNEVFTFQTTGYGSGIVDTVKNNYIGDYSQNYLVGTNNNTLILSNNAFSDATTYNNKIGDDSYNNHIYGNFKNNIIYGNFYNNNIVGSMIYNTINGLFYDNYMADFISNSIFAEFGRIFTDITQGLNSNYINIDQSQSIIDLDLSSSTHIYNTYNCNIFLNSNLDVRLSYYDNSDVLTIPFTGILS